MVSELVRPISWLGASRPQGQPSGVPSRLSARTRRLLATPTQTTLAPLAAPLAAAWRARKRAASQRSRQRALQRKACLADAAWSFAPASPQDALGAVCVPLRFARDECADGESEEAIHIETAGAVCLARPPRSPPRQEDVPGVAGAFVVRGVLSAGECVDLVATAEDMGFSAGSPTARRDVRAHFWHRMAELRAPRCAWLATDSLNESLSARLRPFLPQSCLGGALHGLNRRWRVYRYRPGERFLPHLDDAYVSSYLDASGAVATDRTRRSLLTVLVYLSGDLQGGDTRFWIPDTKLEAFEQVGVRPVVGDALCFFHGSHPLSLIHEGAAVVEGSTKYVLRTDALYERGAEPDDMCAEFRASVRRWPHIYAGRRKWERLGREARDNTEADVDLGSGDGMVQLLEALTQNTATAQPTDSHHRGST